MDAAATMTAVAAGVATTIAMEEATTTTAAATMATTVAIMVVVTPHQQVPQASQRHLYQVQTPGPRRHRTVFPRLHQAGFHHQVLVRQAVSMRVQDHQVSLLQDNSKQVGRRGWGSRSRAVRRLATLVETGMGVRIGIRTVEAVVDMEEGITTKVVIGMDMEVEEVEGIKATMRMVIGRRGMIVGVDGAGEDTAAVVVDTVVTGDMAAMMGGGRKEAARGRTEVGESGTEGM